MIISIDCDKTLSELRMQKLAKKFILSKHDVWVITGRKEGDHNRDLLKIMDKIGLPPQKIIYTNGQEKYRFVTAINADLHIDNDPYECGIINSYTDFVGLCYNTLPAGSWSGLT